MQISYKINVSNTLHQLPQNQIKLMETKRRSVASKTMKMFHGP